MNELLQINEPAGADWLFSLDATATPDQYSANRIFNVDVQGHPFVDGQSYQVFAYHVPTQTIINDLLVFRAQPITTDLPADSAIPSLDMVSARGAITARTIVVGGLASPSWARVSTADFVYVMRPGNGVEEAVLMPISKLLAMLNTPVAPPVVTRRVVGKYKLVDAAGLSAPNAPSNLVVSSGEVASQKALTWKDNADNEAGFAVLRATVNTGPFVQVATTAANVTALYITVAQLRTDYFYQVVALNAAGSSAPSNTVTVRVDPPTVSLKAVFARYGVGAPPPLLKALLDGDIFELLPDGQNFGVIIQTADGKVPPADAFKGMSFLLTNTDTGVKYGWDYNDTSVVPGPDAVFVALRPAGVKLPAGSYSIRVLVYKGGAVLAPFPLNFLLTQPANHPPIAPSIAPISRISGQAYAIVLDDFTDPDPNDSVSKSVGGMPPGVGFIPASRTLLIPAELVAGHFEMTYAGRDQQGATTITPLILDMTSGVVNHPPVAPTNMVPIVVQVNTVSYWSLKKFTDPDPSDTIIHSVSGLPSWSNFNPDFTNVDDVRGPTLFVNAPATPGTYNFTYTGTDNHSSPTSITRTITVNPAN